MTTITLKINEKTKKGKAFLQLAKVLCDEKEVEFFEVPNFETIKAMYDAKNKIGITKTENHDDLMEKLFS